MVMLKGGKYDGRLDTWVPKAYLETEEGLRAQGLEPELEPEPALSLDDEAVVSGIAGAAAPSVPPNPNPPTAPPPEIVDLINRKKTAKAAK